MGGACSHSFTLFESGRLGARREEHSEGESEFTRGATRSNRASEAASRKATGAKPRGERSKSKRQTNEPLLLTVHTLKGRATPGGVRVGDRPSRTRVRETPREEPRICCGCFPATEGDSLHLIRASRPVVP